MKIQPSLNVAFKAKTAFDIKNIQEMGSEKVIPEFLSGLEKDPDFQKALKETSDKITLDAYGFPHCAMKIGTLTPDNPSYYKEWQIIGQSAIQENPKEIKAMLINDIYKTDKDLKAGKYNSKSK